LGVHGESPNMGPHGVAGGVEPRTHTSPSALLPPRPPPKRVRDRPGALRYATTPASAAQRGDANICHAHVAASLGVRLQRYLPVYRNSTIFQYYFPDVLGPLATVQLYSSASSHTVRCSRRVSISHNCGKTSRRLIIVLILSVHYSLRKHPLFVSFG
jgi:hypothetical protein